MTKSPLSKLMTERVGAEFEFGGYVIERATNRRERQEAFELRHRVFRDEGFIEPDAYPSGLFTDQFDEISEHILVRDGGGELIATTRFVRPTPLGFPTEMLFDFSPPAVNRQQLGEYGRLAIRQDHRGGARAPMLGMLKAVFECMVEERITHVYAFLSPKLAASYSALGCVSVPLETKAPSARVLANRKPMSGYFAKQTVIPVLFDLHEMMIEVGVPFDRRELAFVRPQPCSQEDKKSHRRDPVRGQAIRSDISLA